MKTLCSLIFVIFVGTPLAWAQNMPSADPGTATYTWINANVFTPKCLQCHLHAVHVQQDFKYQTILKNAWIKSFQYSSHQSNVNDPTETTLYNSLIPFPQYGSPNPSMPPPGSGIAPVGDIGLRAIYWWILSGAPNN